MNTRTLTCFISGIAVLLIFATSLHLLSSMVQSQEEEENDGEDGEGGGETTPSPTATIVNSKYLTLSGVSFNEVDDQVTISGNVSNISSDQSLNNIIIVGELYDAENTLITAATGTGGLANLQPGQQSAFTMTTNIPSEDEVTRYTVLPGGSVG